jgi:hypothetical protein
VKRRWFIRSIFMLPILLCIVGWGWSVGHTDEGWYCHEGYWVCCRTSSGFVNVLGGPPSELSETEGWGEI